ncbi:MAG: hypothetical protein EGP78_04400 [Alistipes shahii]|nr:hypothetical protein [Alistipes shahii]
MKIERISENQLKLTLTKADLAERKIKLEDLISPSERTQKLFRDIMEQALDEEDFISEKILRQRPACRAVSASSRRRSWRRSASSRNHSAP